MVLLTSSHHTNSRRIPKSLYITILTLLLVSQVHAIPSPSIPNSARDEPASPAIRNVLLSPRQATTTTSAASSGITDSPLTPQNDQTTCGFDGDDNMYGFGIRLGYYIQWVATVVGSLFSSDDDFVSSAFEANAIFNVGMLAGLIYTSITRRTIYAVEPVIVLGFSVGGSIVGLLNPKNVHDSKNLKSLRTRLVFLMGSGATALPIVVYWSWYSWYGIDHMIYNLCATHAFMLVKVNIREQWYRLFLKVATSIALVGFLALGVAIIVLYRMKASELEGENPSPTDIQRQESALAKRSRPTIYQFIVVIVALCICAASVEFGIIWNNIKGVNVLGSTGQLIPLVMGIMTCLQVIGLIVKKKWSNSRRLRKLKKNRLLGNILDIVADAHARGPPGTSANPSTPGRISMAGMGNHGALAGGKELGSHSGDTGRNAGCGDIAVVSPISSMFDEEGKKRYSYVGQAISEKNLEDGHGVPVVQVPAKAASTRPKSWSIMSRSTSSASTNVKGGNKLKRNSGASGPARRNT